MKICPYIAEHYAKRLDAALEPIRDIMYELFVMRDETFFIDEDEPEITLYRLQNRAKEKDNESP